MLLFLTENRTFGIKMSGKLLRCGILTLWAKFDAGLSLCKERETCGVLLDGRETLPMAEAVCAELRRIYPEIPIALLIPPEITVSCMADRLIRETDERQILLEIRLFCSVTCGWRAEMSTYALTVGETAEQTRYLGYPLMLTPRELSILRFLFFRAPQAVTSAELLSVCFPENTQKSANLAVQISHINRRAEEATGLPLIESVYGRGYRLCGGIVNNPELSQAERLQLP